MDSILYLLVILDSLRSNRILRAIRDSIRKKLLLYKARNNRKHLTK